MRTIKFRAWLKRSEEMYQVENLDFEKQKAFVFTDNFDLWVDFGDIELMQFTGLYDKNGKEIYEGDIIQTGHKVNVKVVFSEALSAFVIEYKDGSSNPLYNYTLCQVVGNIYENPELLEK